MEGRVGGKEAEKEGGIKKRKGWKEDALVARRPFQPSR